MHESEKKSLNLTQEVQDGGLVSQRIIFPKLEFKLLLNLKTVETVADFIFGAPKSLKMVIAAMKLKDACSLEGKL